MLSAALPLNLRYAPARSWAWVVKPQPSCCLVQNRPILEKPRYLHIISDPIWKVHLEGACRACDILFSLNPWISGVRGSSLEFRMFQTNCRSCLATGGVKSGITKVQAFLVTGGEARVGSWA